ncbi:MAG: hypothetical protein M3P08_15310 [Thermoproteota archaeon]|nr:hypothetical protein [Thermoproteota archaeon]
MKHTLLRFFIFSRTATMSFFKYEYNSLNPYLRRDCKYNMSEYPYEDKIHSDDRVNYKTVFSSDRIKIGRVDAAFVESFIVKSEKENMEIKYEIPRLEIASIVDNRITLKLKESDLN